MTSRLSTVDDGEEAHKVWINTAIYRNAASKEICASRSHFRYQSHLPQLKSIWPSMKNALSGYYGQRRLFCLGDRSFGPWVEHESSVLIASRQSSAN